MEKNRSFLTERILDLTLEIIYLLTGEEYFIVKKTSSYQVMANSLLHVSQRSSRKQSPKMELPTHSLISDLNNEKKILEAIKKIIELLTGEVPIRCQDVTVYFSMEEWEYLEGNKDLYKDIMMEDHHALTSPDGSRNNPERCPCPLYSRDSTQEPQEIPQDDQGGCVSIVNVTRIEEEEKCTVVQHKQMQVQTDISISKNIQQRSLTPLRFKKSRQEHPNVSYNYQRECQWGNKAEDRERAEDKSLRSGVKEQECQLNVKAQDTKRLEDTFLRTNVQKHECQENLKEKTEDKIVQTDLQKEKHENPLDNKYEVTEKVEAKFLRTEIHRKDHQLDAENIGRQENKFLRTDVQKEQEVPLQSPSKRNTPKRCPHALYHWDSTGEQHMAFRDEKDKRLLIVKTEAMESDNEMCLWRDLMCKEQDSSIDESNNKNTPERCRSPLYSWVSTLNNHKIFSSYQEEKPTQSGGKEALEKMYGRGVEECKEDESPPEIGTDGRYTEYSMEKRSMIFLDGEMEDDIGGDSLEEPAIGVNPYTIPHNRGQSSSPRMLGGSFHSHIPPVTHRTYRRRGETFMCSECGECFTAKAKLFKHQRDHIVDKPHSCPDCGKCFVEKSHLVNHQRSHSVEKPYSCSICGKCFGEKGHLANHEKSHTNEKEFFCYECGKCFTQRGHFNRHQRLHTGEKPYPCPECGKCFPHREYLIRHLRVHAGQKPFPCSECGKCFTDKYDLAKHERIHSGHRPYSCPECGRGFTQKSNLARHIRVHADYSRIHVLSVGNGSPEEPPSSTIPVPVADKRFLCQDMSAE